VTAIRNVGTIKGRYGRATAKEWRDRITANPSVLVGKAVVKGTRLAVGFVLDLLASGWSHADLLANYPNLSEEDIRACIAYASEIVGEERVFPLSGS